MNRDELAEKIMFLTGQNQITEKEVRDGKENEIYAC